MKQYKLVNNVLGWLTFFVAAFVYCSTIEPTASFWDCPEFITTGYKLEVGHPPGAHCSVPPRSCSCSGVSRTLRANSFLRIGAS